MANLYSLTKEDFSILLSDFKVLKNKKRRRLYFVFNKRI
ncbi:conserved hypothetical protein (plasmid) [Borreliella spielmanii A14S]|uniref:Uncharacterized protein n=1 Tax=Borreliella spielmanii A14S TaxID=498742 RepID=C0RBT5_9SPIR|nr:conserved hypothetical protein [Borreliella spielmanii A14S]